MGWQLPVARPGVSCRKGVSAGLGVRPQRGVGMGTRGIQELPRLSQDPFLSVPSQHLQMERRDLSINNLPDFAESALHFLKDLVWCQLWHPMIDLKKCKCLLYCG